MRVCIVGGGAGGRSAARRLRSMDMRAEIDVFSTQNEVGKETTVLLPPPPLPQTRFFIFFTKFLS